MRLGIFAKTFAGSDPLTVLTAARSAGFEAVQYNMACSGLAAMPDLLTPDITAAIRQASADTGVAIAAVSGTNNMIHPDPSVRDTGIRRLALLKNDRVNFAGGVRPFDHALCGGHERPR